jgi:hypothetical protein
MPCCMHQVYKTLATMQCTACASFQQQQMGEQMHRICRVYPLAWPAHCKVECSLPGIWQAQPHLTHNATK